MAGDGESGTGQLTRRPYAASDAADLSELFNAIEMGAGGRAWSTPSDIADLVAALIHDPGTDSRLVVAPDGRLAGAALVPTPPAGGHRVEIFGGVHPERRGRGLGRDLLGWQLARTRQIHETVAPSDAWELHACVLLGDESARRLFRRLGLAPVRYFSEMVARTGRVPAAPLPDGLRLAGYRPEQAEAVHAAHQEAFRDHWGYQYRDLPSWLRLTLHAETFLPGHSRLALDGDQIVGYLLGYRDPDPGRLFIGQVGVRRPWRRRGLASALLGEVLAGAARAGFTIATLGVDAASPTGAVGVYERAGFEVEHRAVMYMVEIPPV